MAVALMVTTCEAAMPKHDTNFERQIFWITTLKHDGTFSSVVRELIHVMLGAGFASASVTECCQGEIWGTEMSFSASH